MTIDILLVEDDTSSRKRLGVFLSKLGHNVVECDNGYLALEALMSKPFHLVLSDIKMPRMSGLELLRTISSLPQYKEVKVILFTGHGDVELAVEALRAGASDYLLKPINIAELVEVIERISRQLDNKKGNQPKKTKVMLACHYPLTREGFYRILENSEEFLVTGYAATFDECIRKMKTNTPNVVIIEERAEQDDWLGICKVLREEFPSVAVLFIFSRSKRQILLDAIEQGVNGFLLKEADIEDILHAIRKVSKGEKYINSHLAESVLKEGTSLGPTKESDGLKQLTTQEREVFGYLVKGLTNQEIADRMFLSKGTVRNYVSDVLKKLGLPNRLAAAAYYYNSFDDPRIK